MSIIDNIKSITTTIRQIDNIELYRRILDLQAEIMNVVSENQELRQENSSLSEKLVTKQAITFDNSAYWTRIDDKRDGPYCTRCWDLEKNLIRLHPCGNPAMYDCPNCKSGPIRAKPELDRPAQVFRPRIESYE